MNEQKRILGNCFRSNSSLWNDYLSAKGETNILYYPSAGEDLRPFLFSNIECLNYTGLELSNENFIEPDLFIFSDYFPFQESRFFDTNTLYADANTLIRIENYCELTPHPQYFTYQFNRAYVDFDKSHATGRALFFKAKIYSHINGGIHYYKYGIYFFYENINLIDQLFIRHQLPVSHIVWKRDGGSGFGGGRVVLNFMYALAELLDCKYLFLWNHYQNKEVVEVTENDLISAQYHYPVEIKDKLPKEYSMLLRKVATFNWSDDVVNLYFKQK